MNAEQKNILGTFCIIVLAWLLLIPLCVRIYQHCVGTFTGHVGADVGIELFLSLGLASIAYYRVQHSIIKKKAG